VYVHICNKGRVLAYIGKYLILRARVCMWTAKG